ncbi:MAG: type II secretion system protein GspN [Nitrospiraceae bacterium]|nr:type II secretion system protein GspN [Nitrospiraceae bacterium]
MKKKHILTAALSVAAAIMLFWYAAVPDAIVPQMISNRVGDLGVSVEAQGFHKGLFLNFSADTLDIKYGGKLAVRLDNLQGHISPLSLLLLKVRMPFHSGVSGGDIDGVFAYGLLSGKKDIKTLISNVQVGRIPAVKDRLQGILNARLEFAGERGQFVYKMEGMKGFPYDFTSSNGVLDLSMKDIRIKSVSLDSDWAYARMKGSITGGFYDLKTEVMPHSASYNYMLAQYEVSPGYYVIPASGRLQELL